MQFYFFRSVHLFLGNGWISVSISQPLGEFSRNLGLVGGIFRKAFDSGKFFERNELESFTNKHAASSTVRIKKE